MGAWYNEKLKITVSRRDDDDWAFKGEGVRQWTLVRGIFGQQQTDPFSYYQIFYGTALVTLFKREGQIVEKSVNCDHLNFAHNY